MSARSTLPQYAKLSPATVEGLRGISDATKANLDLRLVELVKLRVSQINGCAFCIERHLAEARKVGLGDEPIHMLPVWHEATIFSEKERTALAWAEALTRVSEGPVSDDAYAEASRLFTPAELANLTGAIIAINGFNRVAVAYRFQPSKQ